MAMYAPIGLLGLAASWVVLVIAGFTLVYWGLGVDPLRQAFLESGSSLLTLGFVKPGDLPTSIAAFVEATLGLGEHARLVARDQRAYVRPSTRGESREVIVGDETGTQHGNADPGRRHRARP